jgi:hypothetical protein
MLATSNVYSNSSASSVNGRITSGPAGIGSPVGAFIYMRCCLFAIEKVAGENLKKI